MFERINVMFQYGSAILSGSNLCDSSKEMEKSGNDTEKVLPVPACFFKSKRCSSSGEMFERKLTRSPSHIGRWLSLYFVIGIFRGACFGAVPAVMQMFESSSTRSFRLSSLTKVRKPDGCCFRNCSTISRHTTGQLSFFRCDVTTHELIGVYSNGGR